VPVFSQCTSGANAEHAAPLSGPSCEPPAPTSSIASVGATSVGTAQLSAASGDLAIAVTDSDIQTPTGEDYDPSPSGTADLAEVSRLRITDIGHCSTSGCTGPYDQPGTSTDLDFGPVPIECLPNGDPSTAPGSDCNVTTSANSVTPGAIAAGRQTVLQVFRVKINDANGDLFQQQGIYEP
jgi:hypothetical protein